MEYYSQAIKGIMNYIIIAHQFIGGQWLGYSLFNLYSQR